MKNAKREKCKKSCKSNNAQGKKNTKNKNAQPLGEGRCDKTRETLALYATTNSFLWF